MYTVLSFTTLSIDPMSPATLMDGVTLDTLTEVMAPEVANSCKTLFGHSTGIFSSYKFHEARTEWEQGDDEITTRTETDIFNDLDKYEDEDRRNALEVLWNGGDFDGFLQDSVRLSEMADELADEVRYTSKMIQKFFKPNEDFDPEDLYIDTKVTSLEVRQGQDYETIIEIHIDAMIE